MLPPAGGVHHAWLLIAGAGFEPACHRWLPALALTLHVGPASGQVVFRDLPVRLPIPPSRCIADKRRGDPAQREDCAFARRAARRSRSKAARCCCINMSAIISVCIAGSSEGREKGESKRAGDFGADDGIRTRNRRSRVDKPQQTAPTRQVGAEANCSAN